MGNKNSASANISAKGGKAGDDALMVTEAKFVSRKQSEDMVRAPPPKPAPLQQPREKAKVSSASSSSSSLPTPPPTPSEKMQQSEPLAAVHASPAAPPVPAKRKSIEEDSSSSSASSRDDQVDGNREQSNSQVSRKSNPFKKDGNSIFFLADVGLKQPFSPAALLAGLS